MPVVLEAVSFESPRRERQHGIETVERLNLRLLVEREDSRVLGRIQVQANHVGGLGLEVGIVRGHITLGPVRLDASPTPDPLNQHVADPKCGPELTGGPMGRTVLGLALRPRQDAGLHSRSRRRRFATLVPGVHTRHTLLKEAAPPTTDVCAAAADGPLNLVVGFAVSQHQHDSCPTGFVGSAAARLDAGLEYLPILRRKANGVLGAHV